MLFSLIIPVYNRPDDLREVLDGLTQQTDQQFEVVVVESGSTIPAKHVVENFQDRLDIHYVQAGNHGQGFSRNRGMKQARGDYFIILDSDIIIPPHYIETVRQHLQSNYLDAFGGPDRAHASFTSVQKAADFALTSYLTTGGTRGNRRQAARYRPRSFNMGFSRAVYEATGGFALPNCGEDIELSIRIQKLGYRTGLIPGAFVYHKRKETLNGFFQQMVWFGKSRINLHRIEPGSLRAIHLIPLLFFAYLALALVLSIVVPPLGGLLGLLLLVYAGVVLVTASVRYRSLRVGALSVITAFSVFIGYGYGLVKYHFQQKEPYTPVPP